MDFDLFDAIVPWLIGGLIVIVLVIVAVGFAFGVWWGA